jgi:hypothetical protein
MTRGVWILCLLGTVAAGWALWHYRQFRRCGELTCSPTPDDPTLRLPNGGEVRVLRTHRDEARRLTVDYVTSLDRTDRDGLCLEARNVWESLGAELATDRLERAVLSPVSPSSEFLGMKWVVVPLYTCCVPTPLRVERARSGDWTFPDCS